MINVAIALGLIAIIGLVIYIYRTSSALKKAQAEQQANLLEQQKEQAEKQAYVSDSIRIIVKSLATEQIEVVEAGIRLKVLLDQLQPKLTAEPYDDIEQVFEKTAHIPKLKAWKALTRKERKDFEKEMSDVQKQHQAGVKAAAQEIESLMAQRS